jgi:hypothetical protein
VALTRSSMADVNGSVLLRGTPCRTPSTLESALHPQAKAYSKTNKGGEESQRQNPKGPSCVCPTGIIRPLVCKGRETGGMERRKWSLSDAFFWLFFFFGGTGT